MLNHLLGITLEVRLVGDGYTYLVIVGILSAHPTLANWYYLSLNGRNAFLTFEVDSYILKGRNANDQFILTVLLKSINEVSDLEKRSKQ